MLHAYHDQCVHILICLCPCTLVCTLCTMLSLHLCSYLCYLLPKAASLASMPLMSRENTLQILVSRLPFLLPLTTFCLLLILLKIKLKGYHTNESSFVISRNSLNLIKLSLTMVSNMLLRFLY